MAIQQAAHGAAGARRPSSSSSEWRRPRLPRSPSSRLGSRSARRGGPVADEHAGRAIPVSVAAPRDVPRAALRTRARARLARHRALAARRRRRALRGSGPPPSRRGCCICRSSSTATWSRAPRGSSRTRSSAPARRGEIFDRNGNLLAYTVDADSIIADPGEIEDPDAVAATICRRARPL